MVFEAKVKSDNNPRLIREYIARARKAAAFDRFGRSFDNTYFFDPRHNPDAGNLLSLLDQSSVATLNRLEAGLQAIYLVSPITSGLEPIMAIIAANRMLKQRGEPLITTTYKLSEWLGSEDMGRMTDRYVTNNLQVTKIARLAFPDLTPIAPVVREATTKLFGHDPSFTRGENFEGEHYMALWYPVADYSKAMIFYRHADLELIPAVAMGGATVRAKKTC